MFRLQVRARNISGQPRHFFLRGMVREELPDEDGQIVIDLTGRAGKWRPLVELASGDARGRECAMEPGSVYAFDGDVPAPSRGIRWVMLPMDRAAWEIERLRVNGVEHYVVTTLQ